MTAITTTSEILAKLAATSETLVLGAGLETGDAVGINTAPDADPNVLHKVAGGTRVELVAGQFVRVKGVENFLTMIGDSSGNTPLKTNSYVTINGHDIDEDIDNTIAGEPNYMLGIWSDVANNPCVVIKTDGGDYIQFFNQSDTMVGSISSQVGWIFTAANGMFVDGGPLQAMETFVVGTDDAGRGVFDVQKVNGESYFGSVVSAQALCIGNSRRLNFGDMLIGKNIAGVTGADTYRALHTGSFGFCGIDFQFGGDIAFYASSEATTAEAVVTPATRLLLSGTTGHATFDGAVKPKSYTVGTVPSASTAGAGATIYVTDDAGGSVEATSDGTNWRRSTDRAIIST